MSAAVVFLEPVAANDSFEFRKNLRSRRPARKLGSTPRQRRYTTYDRCSLCGAPRPPLCGKDLRKRNAITQVRYEILISWFAGRSIAQIAAARGRSEHTVRDTLTQIGIALGARTRVSAFCECLRLRIVSLDVVAQEAQEATNGT